MVPVTILYQYDVDPALIRCGGTARRYPLRTGTQVEGVAYNPGGTIYFTAEKLLRKQALYKAY